LSGDAVDCRAAPGSTSLMDGPLVAPAGVDTEEVRRLRLLGVAAADAADVDAG
jgi:hypothetical protein